MLKHFIYFLTGILLGFTIVANATSTTNDITLTEKNTLSLYDAVYYQTTAKLEQKARELDAILKSNEPLYLVLDTPGGSVQVGLEFIQNLSTLNRPVHTLTIFAASMGFHIVQNLGNRYILKHGVLMTHKPRGLFYGEFPGQLDSRYKFSLLRLFSMDKEVVKRTKGKHTLKSYTDLYENEYWCDGNDCIEQGFADKIVNVGCDKSLETTREEVWDKFIYRGHTVEIIVVMADCPLTTGFLEYLVYIDGEPLFKTNNNLYYTAEDIDAQTLSEINDKVKDKLHDKKVRKIIKGY